MNHFTKYLIDQIKAETPIIHWVSECGQWVIDYDYRKVKKYKHKLKDTISIVDYLN